jgi:hypothetical protein
MTILEGDIKLLASKVMDDVPEGGGGPSGTVIADGASNAIFADVTELDRAGGAVSIRQLHATVRTANVDSFMGANVIVADPPNDPNVTVTLTPCAPFARRTDIAQAIENYLIAGPVWGGYLLENHVAGQRNIQMFQRVGDPTPNIGQTLVLVQSEGQPSERKQYVRVTRVSSVERTFVGDDGKEYRAAVVTCEISDALRTDFTGSPPSKYFQRAANATLIRDTTVADAGNYVGASPLTAVAHIGDATVTCASIFTQLVPSSQTEVPITDVKPNGDTVAGIAAGGSITRTISTAWDATHAIYLGGGVMPGSLSIASGSNTITDAAGRLYAGTTEVGSIDYQNGILTATTNLGASHTATYKPAAFPALNMQTAGFDVTAETRAGTFVFILTPVPSPQTLSVSYMAQGRWYVLREDGSGKIKGIDAAYGSGMLNFVTGSVSVTLGALPDVGSTVMLTWGTKTTQTQRAGGTVKAEMAFDLAHSGVAPGTLTITWTDGAATKTATDNSAGQLTGDATGTVTYTSGKVVFVPNNMLPANATLNISYQWGPKIEETFEHPIRNSSGHLEITLANQNVLPNTMEVEWNLLVDVNAVNNDYVYTQNSFIPSPTSLWRDPTKIVRDTGSGSLQGITGSTVNYSAGTLEWNPDLTISLPVPNYAKTVIGTTSLSLPSGTLLTNTIHQHLDGFRYVPCPAIYPSDLSGYVKVRYRTASAGNAASETQTWTPYIDVTRGYDEQLVPGSLLLQFGPKLLVEREGRLDVDINPANGSGTQWGSISYATGRVTLTQWLAGQANSFNILAMLTTLGMTPCNEITFRTPMAPLRPGSLTMQFQFAGNTTLTTITADASGNIVSGSVNGKVDYQTGTVRLLFGQELTVTPEIQSEEWFVPEAVYTVGGVDKIWKPRMVLVDTFRFACVAYSYLPIDASILGLDPVRLPQDGQVPMFRVGGYAVVGHTGRVGPVTVSNGQTINCARTRLSRLRVVGNDGLVINTGYTADLDAGTITFTDVSGYSQPVTVEHRVEDMVRVRDVQINGTLSLSRALSHEFPVPGSYVSGALVAGNLKARVSGLWDQATWDGVTWVDYLVGSAATASYNDTVAPIAVTNAGAITQRWALRFTSSSTFDVIGENVGNLGNYSINADCAPVNPISGQPYFTIRATGWGLGWAAGNTVRINTVGAMYSYAAVRTVQPSAAAGTDFKFELLVRGDVDRPPSP